MRRLAGCLRLRVLADCVAVFDSRRGVWLEQLARRCHGATHSPLLQRLRTAAAAQSWQRQRRQPTQSAHSSETRSTRCSAFNRCCFSRGASAPAIAIAIPIAIALAIAIAAATRADARLPRGIRVRSRDDKSAHDRVLCAADGAVCCALAAQPQASRW